MTQFVLAIDIGTTSTKALAVLSSGEVVKSHQSFYPTQYPRAGFAEQNATQILEAVKEVINVVVKDTSTEYSLAALCFSSAMHSLMAVDKDGQPLTQLIIWADTRSSAQARQLRDSEVGNRLHDQTGTPIHPMSPLCKLLWCKQHDPELLLHAHKFISIKEFVIFHLCGEFLIDYSVASATGLFDIKSLQWSAEAFNLIGVSKARFSTPISGYQAVHINSHTDLPSTLKSVPVFLGANDGCLAQLGSDAMSEGDLTITVGTSGAVRRVGAKEIKDSERKLFRYLLDAETLIVGGATNNGSVIIDWFGREFGPSSNLMELSKLASEIPAGCDGLIALPFLLGERAPIYNPDARGVFFNVSLRHTKAHFLRALIEGICFELFSLVKSVEKACGPSNRVLVSGGVTHAPEFIKIISNVMGKELIISGSHDASAMGAAQVAFHALGISFHQSRSEQITITPDPAFREIYDRQFKIFESLYSQLESQFGRVPS